MIAVESDKTFILHLESLQRKLGRKLYIIDCVFFKLGPRSFGLVKPVMNPKLLFCNLGIEKKISL